MTYINDNLANGECSSVAAYRMCNMFIVSEHLCICRTLKWNMCSFPISQGLQTPIHFTEAILEIWKLFCSFPLVLSCVQVIYDVLF